jgi:hypothetical protein
MTPTTKLALKLSGWAFLIHVILIGLTVAEVFIYSIVINTDQPNSFYEEHAQQSGPIIGIVIGFVVVWWIARMLMLKNSDSRLQISWGLPTAYVVIDIVMLVMAGIPPVSTWWIFGISYSTKFVAGYMALKSKG